MAATRARLTLPGLLSILFALAVLGGLWPVVYDAMATNVGQLSTGELYAFRLLLPAMVLVMLTVLYVEATGGA